ncbi:MAG: NAD(P)-dependent alcohol dehydrogenase [Candidatus Schekmanbacteria bacterium]|nr:NAD(P)-dependent alcohol dehydrogenase [Candidatus Schekmanbacteria bacterium]
MKINAFAAYAAAEALATFTFEAGPLAAGEVEVEVEYCGVCHSDIHLIDNDWGISSYPLVAGHEIVGTVVALGDRVVTPELGARVGIGWQRGCCGSCEWCLTGDQNLCPASRATCVGHHGGYATRVRCDAAFAVPIPGALAPAMAAPLLCGGVTVYAPLVQFGVRPAHSVGVIGIGGLGHLAIRFARAFGCRVTAFSSSPEKAAEAARFGAHDFVTTQGDGGLKKAAGTVDFLISTASADLSWPDYVDLLRPNGTLCIVGASPGPVQVSATALILGRRSIRGSAIGSPPLIREMLSFAARNEVVPQIEILPLRQVNDALDKVRANRARYRMVLAVKER